MRQNLLESQLMNLIHNNKINDMRIQQLESLINQLEKRINELEDYYRNINSP